MPQDSYYENRERRTERDPYSSPRQEHDAPRPRRKKKHRSAGRTAALVLLCLVRDQGLLHLDLKKLGVVLKRAKYFIVCNGKSASPLPTDNPAVIAGAISERGLGQRRIDPPEQLSFFAPIREDGVKCLTGQI